MKVTPDPVSVINLGRLTSITVCAVPLSISEPADSAGEAPFISAERSFSVSMSAICSGLDMYL